MAVGGYLRASGVEGATYALSRRCHHRNAVDAALEAASPDWIDMIRFWAASRGGRCHSCSSSTVAAELGCLRLEKER